jgi:hypothetical protein
MMDDFSLMLGGLAFKLAPSLSAPSIRSTLLAASCMAGCLSQAHSVSVAHSASSIAVRLDLFMIGELLVNGGLQNDDNVVTGFADFG